MNYIYDSHNGPCSVLPRVNSNDIELRDILSFSQINAFFSNLSNESKVRVFESDSIFTIKMKVSLLV